MCNKRSRNTNNLNTIVTIRLIQFLSCLSHQLRTSYCEGCPISMDILSLWDVPSRKVKMSHRDKTSCGDKMSHRDKLLFCQQSKILTNVKTISPLHEEPGVEIIFSSWKNSALLTPRSFLLCQKIYLYFS